MAQFRRGTGAVSWAREITDYINAQFPETTLQVFVARYSSLNTICWMADFPDMASLDEWQSRVAADSGYRELRQKSFEMLIEGSLYDSVLIAL